MALIVSEPPKKEVSVSIVSSTAEDEENFEEFEEEMPEETPVDPSTDPVADVAVTTDVVVENVQVVSDASDVDAAPLAVELSEFGDITAPASDMLSTIGAVGGTGGGYGGRKNAGRLAATGGGGADTESAVDKALKWFIAPAARGSARMPRVMARTAVPPRRWRCFRSSAAATRTRKAPTSHSSRPASPSSRPSP
jgi:hypothetical protein